MRLRSIWLGMSFFAAAFAQAGEAVLEGLTAHLADHPDGGEAFSFPRAAYAKEADLAGLPIGVFDSGIGGLTVLEALLNADVFHNDNLQPGADGRPDFVEERFIYLGDQANMPYGNYPSSGKTDYLRELILKDALFLLGNRYWPKADAPQPSFDKPPVKALVIACNTATAYGLEDVRAAAKEWGVPVFVVGVVEAGARGLLQAPEDGAVGGFGDGWDLLQRGVPKDDPTDAGFGGPWDREGDAVRQCTTGWGDRGRPRL